MNNYTVGVDVSENTSQGCFVVWDRKKNTIHKIIETKYIKFWLFVFKLKGIKIFKEA